jgi:hypothetical protein
MPKSASLDASSLRLGELGESFTINAFGTRREKGASYRTPELAASMRACVIHPDEFLVPPAE